MNSVEVFISVEDPRWQETVSGINALAEKTLNTAVKMLEKDVWFLAEDKNFSLNLCLSNDAEVHKLNYEFRGLDKPTNVLSFANQEDEDFEDALQGEDVELGDVIVAYETMLREAEEQGVSLRDHFCHLWVHGILHVLGYDHMTEEDAAEMEALEVEILSRLGVANPYQE